MKKFFLGAVVLTVIFAWFLTDSDASTRIVAAETNAVFVSPNLVISQFQPGTSAVPNDEFIEIHNNGSAAVDLNGYRVVYRSQNGVADVPVPFAVWTTSTILQPGQYYLIASTSYTGSATPNITYNPTTCQCSMSAAEGGLAIRQGPQDTGVVIDAVGWGTATNIFFEGTRTVAPGSGNSKERLQQGCQDTDNNAADFATLSPFAPRNMTTAVSVCSGGGTTLFAAMNANPPIVTPPANVLFTVTTIPATTPPSTGITVVGNLSEFGGAASQAFFDNGTNGDVTAGDNVFSFAISIPAGTPGGIRNVFATRIRHSGTFGQPQPEHYDKCSTGK